MMLKRLIVVSSLLLMLAGCGSTTRGPTLNASGYIADNGVVRVWTKVSGDNQPIRLMRVYTPYSGETISTYYEYLAGKLSLIRSNVQNSEKLPQILLRLDAEGNPSFMERKLPERNEQLSSDDILRLKYEEQRTLMASRSLSAGDIRLHQGYIRDGSIITCQGETVTPTFSAEEQSWINKRISNGGFISLAWLTAPRGIQLLLVANENFCQWEPSLDAF
ncbi:DUF1481 domain-containing protein [Pragia fontium]|nr:DUF1481 domain-containing protein [Pragia fontium]GKX64670.1 hypothetical protein SOASR032_32390 [Pragia fontium]